MELLAEGVLDAIGGGLKALFGQLAELLLLAGIVVSGEDGVFAAGAVLAGEASVTSLESIGSPSSTLGGDTTTYASKKAINGKPPSRPTEAYSSLQSCSLVSPIPQPPSRR